MKVDKSIYVFDNFVSKAKQTFYYDYIIKSFFKIGWEDLEEFDKRGYPCLHSSYTRQNVDHSEAIAKTLTMYSDLRCSSTDTRKKVSKIDATKGHQAQQ